MVGYIIETVTPFKIAFQGVFFNLNFKFSMKFVVAAVKCPDAAPAGPDRRLRTPV